MGAGITATIASATAVPPGPEHAIANLEDVFMGSLVTVPDASFEPAHASEAVQLVVFVEFQDSVAVPPAATLVGDADNVTVGAGGGGGGGGEGESESPPPPQPASTSKTDAKTPGRLRAPRKLLGSVRS